MIDRLVEYQAKERLLSPLFCTTIISRFAQFGKYFFEVAKMSEKNYRRKSGTMQKTQSDLTLLL